MTYHPPNLTLTSCLIWEDKNDYDANTGVELTARPLPGDTRQSVARTGAVVDAVVDYLSSLPALFSRQFYFYVLTGTFLYGSMVSHPSGSSNLHRT